jgi:hypothetical protein
MYAFFPGLSFQGIFVRASGFFQRQTPRANARAWIVLPMLSSILLLAVTNQLCTDVASGPFLWVLPSSIYLLTFALTFTGWRFIYHRVVFFCVLLAAGVGLALMEYPHTGSLRIGAVGLGIGTIASYARPGDVYCFYEINPDVISLARDERYFHLQSPRDFSDERTGAGAWGCFCPLYTYYE